MIVIPLKEVGEKDEAGRGIEFFGGCAEGLTEVFGEFANGQDFEDGMSEDPLPTVFDNRPAGRWNNPLKRVEEAILSGVDEMDHIERNSLSKNPLSIE